MGEYADVEVGQRQSREAEDEDLVAEAGTQRTQEVTGAVRLESAKAGYRENQISNLFLRHKQQQVAESLSLLVGGLWACWVPWPCLVWLDCLVSLRCVRCVFPCSSLSD